MGRSVGPIIRERAAEREASFTLDAEREARRTLADHRRTNDFGVSPMWCASIAEKAAGVS